MIQHTVYKSKIKPPEKQQIVLVFQGGGAIGAYQYGAYEALHNNSIEPDWLIGTSIGAINGGLIAGNPPEKRVKALKTFWDLMKTHGRRSIYPSKDLFDFMTVTTGVEGFFRPNYTAWVYPNADLGIDKASYYSTDPLRTTLGELINIDYLNSKNIRLTVGAVNANTGQMRYFDSRDEELSIEHIMASASLPPAFPATLIKGEPYWDGGVFSNTPMEAIFEDRPRLSSLIFSVQLWNPEGGEPKSINGVINKIKDIQYASRNHYLEKERQLHRLRHVIRELGTKLTDEVKKTPEVKELLAWGCGTKMHIIQLTVDTIPGEDDLRDIDFSTEGITARYHSGLEGTIEVLKSNPWVKHIDPIEGIRVHPN